MVPVRRQNSPNFSAGVLSQPLAPASKTVLKITPILFTTVSQTALQKKSAKIFILNEESEIGALQMITAPYLRREEVADLARGPEPLKFKLTDFSSTFLPILNNSGMCSS